MLFYVEELFFKGWFERALFIMKPFPAIEQFIPAVL